MYSKSANFPEGMPVITVFRSLKEHPSLDDKLSLNTEFIVIAGLFLKNGRYGIKKRQKWHMSNSYAYLSGR